ncbi:hypothetical protein PINS_up015496 [Pythium insidiosum]|nr:hypothetical protein PINS_up015496 [Pythium insidiosum]
MMERWRDPMHVLFSIAAAAAQGATLFMRYAGLLFVLIGISLIVFVGGIFVYAIIPLVAESAVEVLTLREQTFCHALFTVTLLFNIYFNYALCIATNPYFFSFLAWLTLGCLYAAVVSFGPAYQPLSDRQIEKLDALSNNPVLRHFEVPPSAYLQFVFCIAVSAGIAVSILLGWHVYLVASAQTSVEYQINRSTLSRRRNGGKPARSPYHQGSLHGNWVLALGHCDYKLSSLLPGTQPPPDLTWKPNGQFVEKFDSLA